MWGHSLPNARQIACACLLTGIVDIAAADPAPQVLDTVTVTATRTRETPYNVPAAISVVPAQAFRQGDREPRSALVA